MGEGSGRGRAGSEGQLGCPGGTFGGCWGQQVGVMASEVGAAAPYKARAARVNDVPGAIHHTAHFSQVV